ncbi:MAG TPA: LLM class flavin-dependent oxidoreductase [Jiangellaceae bacterium]|nr:LLM class flavin-dependent oxidoreductase [Jiangellaceae bacterium]
MRRLWTEGRATFDGEHYQVDGAICRPLPLQDGGFPMWVAGGERKTLRIAAKYAQYTNFGGILGIFRRKSEILAQHCLDLGTDFDAITRSSNDNVIVGETQADVDDQFARLTDLYGRYVPADLVEPNSSRSARAPPSGRRSRWSRHCWRCTAPA